MTYEEEPLVSVCCITYNHESFIRNALDGFLSQETNFPIEIIIHDDASTDDTARIIEEYQREHPQKIFPILQTENQYSKGVKPYSEFVFPRARGKYIAICEGDDYWTDPQKLQKQVDVLERDDTLVGCFHEAIIEYDEHDVLFSRENHNDLNQGAFSLKDILESEWLIPTASLVFRNVGIKFPEMVKKMKVGDFALCCLVFSKGPGYYINEPMARYNKRNPTSFTNSKFILDNITTKTDRIRFLVWLNRHTDHQYSQDIEDRLVRESDEINGVKDKFVASRSFRFYSKYKKLLTSFT